MREDLTSAESVWWRRVRAAADAQGNAGSKLMSDWANVMLAISCPDASGFGDEWVDEQGLPVPPSRWRDEDVSRQPVRPEQHTPEYKQQATRRLKDELGRKLGVGPSP